MGLFSQDIKTMDDLFIHQLKDIYYAEKRILNALQEMKEKASSDDLRQAFERNLMETRMHVRRVEQVFRQHDLEPDMVKCPAIDGIVDEVEEVADEITDKRVLDAALIAAAQAVEHYEISRYGTLVAWARTLGWDDQAGILQQTLDEEKAADATLTGLAEAYINAIAR